MWTPGMGELLIIFAIVMLVFGTGKLRNVGKDLGGAIGEFRNSMKSTDGDDESDDKAPTENNSTEEQPSS